MLLFTPAVSSLQSCYSACNQEIPFNTVLERPTNCNVTRNSSLLCAVSVTFYSNRQTTIGIFYFTPTISNSRPCFVETDVTISTGTLNRHTFYECADCDIFESARDIVATMQSVLTIAPIVISQIRDLIEPNNTTKMIECYKGNEENQIVSPCLTCLLEINTNKTSNRLCNILTSNSLKVNLNELTTLDDKRTFGTINIECSRQHCNTLTTARSALWILFENGLSQHAYELTPSTAVSSFSIFYPIAYLFVFISFLY
ncbi:unnamed protein product [Rotaria socialis]|uniref:Uncharacterized protein n=2 Tax=Rotaria socialis TaxID=392032 RepID=A0A817XW05_9BILA|nr:unnamed protein product [Rotaria socialis]CAF3372949.1 unnamed protein product [Rotaria socialis]CAF4156578.1 unnamed protein product [Rotaria socialis]CAF4192392.1 unnamed protein product [Rotaria socialis]CAF4518697.1 unnamed protein product [Rotaria socialis]